MELVTEPKTWNSHPERGTRGLRSPFPGRFLAPSIAARRGGASLLPWEVASSVTSGF